MRLRPRTIRGRVAGWVLLIVTVALSLNLLAVTTYLSQRDRSAVEAELEHEAVKFHRFVRASQDEAGSRPTVSALLRAYVAQAFPDRNESLFSVVDGRAEYRTASSDPVRLDLDRRVIRRAVRTTRPFTIRRDTDEGAVVASVIPIRADEPDGQRGALVVVESTQARQADVAKTVRLLGLLGLAALVVTGLVSWFVAGRIAAPLRQVRRTAEAIDEEQLAARIPIDDTLDEDVLAMASTFNRMLDRLGSAMESQRDFLDDAAHELRTPLTVIRGHLETRGGGSSGDETSAHLLISEVDRMDRLVGDLLMLAKSGRPDFLDRHVVDLDDLVVRVVASASALGTRRWRVVGTADARVLADEQRLTQALMQLAVNAVEHTQPGDTVAVGVCTGCSEFELSVTDTGPGIPEEERERIFDRFQQGSRDQPGSGSGLGLAIVRSIAQAHGGRAEVSSAPGGGACFRLVLPRHDVVEADPSLTNTQATAEEESAEGSSPW